MSQSERLGVILAYCFPAFPYTYAYMSNTYLHAPVCIYMHTKTDYKPEWKYDNLENKKLEIRE